MCNIPHVEYSYYVWIQLSVMVSDDEFIVNKLKRQLNQVKDFVENRGSACTTEMVYGGNIAEQVLNYAKIIKADLIMIMTQQEMNWTDLFIGSSAQQIINYSDIPVLSIRPSVKKDPYLHTPYW